MSNVINKNMSTTDLCNICNKIDFKYTCPRCNTLYCSLECYKSPQHQNCSEEFYKKCVQDELSATDKNFNGDIRKMYDILNRMNDVSDYGDEPESELDSDDENDEDDTDSIANRLEGIDINDSDEIWNHLTGSEQKEFQDMIENGEIMKLLPKYQPWWIGQGSKLVVAVSDEIIPKICDSIPEFSAIYSKEPPPCIHNNLWNVMASYACTVKFFNGEHQTNSWEAANYFLALSVNLQRNTNFDNAEQAVVSIEMEALEINVPLPCEEFKHIQRDTRQIMSAKNFKLAALSDTLNLFKVAKEQRFTREFKSKTCEFIQRFKGEFLADLTKSKINLVIKKIEFFLSFVQRYS